MSSADLTELLRASRPAAPETLKERVRAMSSAPPARTSWTRYAVRLPRLRLAVPALAATAVAAAALVAVIRPAHDNRATDALQRQELTNKLDTTGSQVQKAAAPSLAAGAATPTPSTGDRAVDYQAQIGIEVSDTDALSAATKRATTIARSLGGYVLSSQYSATESGRAMVTVRVPTARVQDALAQLTGLGKITSQQVQIQDLQEQLDRLAQQAAVLRGRIAHITALLGNPDLTSTRRAQLETQRAQLQADLRTLRQQESGVSHQAAFATIQLTLATKEGAGTPVPASRARRTLDEAGRILAWEGVALLYGLVVAGPFALVAGIVWLGARLRRRGEEQRLLARP